jgi:hypothetical protein
VRKITSARERLNVTFGPSSATSPRACRSRSQCCRNRKRVSRTKTRPACKRGLAAKRCASVRDLPDETDVRLTEHLRTAKTLSKSLTLTPNEAAKLGLSLNRDGQRRSAFELLARSSEGGQSIST